MPEPQNEQELVVRLLRSIAWHWRMVLLATIVAAISAAVFSQLTPPTFTAEASILIRSRYSQVTLDPRFVTSETKASDAYQTRQALLGLAKSKLIEAHMPAATRTKLLQNIPQDVSLADNISVHDNGDWIQIIAETASPEQAPMLADAWATTFVDYANKLYRDGGVEDDIATQIREASGRYVAAQRAYEQFVGSNRIRELEQNIDAVVGVITHTAEVEKRGYSDYLARAQGLELVLRDAQALRSQLDSAQSIGQGERLALLLLRARASSDSELSVQVGTEQSPDVTEDPGAIRADLDELLALLPAQISATRAAAAELAGALTADGGTSSSGLTAAQRQTYYTQLLGFEQQLAQETSRLRLLEQARGVTQEALVVVQRKAAEQQVTATAENAVVVLASSASDVESSIAHTPLWIIAGGVAGALLGMIIAVVLGLLGISLPSLHRKQALDGHSIAQSRLHR